MGDSPGAVRAGDPGQEKTMLATVVASLTGRIAVDGREERSRERTLVALGRLPHPFDEDADPTHVTGSAIVIGPRGVLLHRHKRLGLWLQPGGHLEPGETPWDAALREAREETGLDLSWPGPDMEKENSLAEENSRPRVDSIPTLAHVDVHDGGRGHTHLDLRYEVRVVGDQDPHPPVGESQAVRWFTWPEAIAMADAGLAGFLRRAAAGR
jgi:8-oxo-dGTP pyrophosphatase MutT (NUDIX family)